MEPLLRTVVAIALEVMLNFLLEVLDVSSRKKDFIWKSCHDHNHRLGYKFYYYSTKIVVIQTV